MVLEIVQKWSQFHYFFNGIKNELHRTFFSLKERQILVDTSEILYIFDNPCRDYSTKKSSGHFRSRYTR